MCLHVHVCACVWLRFSWATKLTGFVSKRLVTSLSLWLNRCGELGWAASVSRVDGKNVSPAKKQRGKNHWHAKEFAHFVFLCKKKTKKQTNKQKSKKPKRGKQIQVWHAKVHLIFSGLCGFPVGSWPTQVFLLQKPDVACLADKQN